MEGDDRDQSGEGVWTGCCAGSSESSGSSSKMAGGVSRNWTAERYRSPAWLPPPFATNVRTTSPRRRTFRPVRHSSTSHTHPGLKGLLCSMRRPNALMSTASRGAIWQRRTSRRSFGRTRLPRRRSRRGAGAASDTTVNRLNSTSGNATGLTVPGTRECGEIRSTWKLAWPHLEQYAGARDRPRMTFVQYWQVQSLMVGRHASPGEDASGVSLLAEDATVDRRLCIQKQSGCQVGSGNSFPGAVVSSLVRLSVCPYASGGYACMPHPKTS